MQVDDPNDFVRIEIREALSRNIPVVPVLLDEIPMPKIEQLPDGMKRLVPRQAEFVGTKSHDRRSKLRWCGSCGQRDGRDHNNEHDYQFGLFNETEVSDQP
jgi:hypothetical protein